MLARRFWKRIGFYCGAGLMIAMIAQPQLCVDAAQRAMCMWFESVAPALFPFLALMPLITGDTACAAYNRLFRRAMRLFDLPGSAAPAAVIGMIAGSPGGAMAARRIGDGAGLNVGQLRRLLPAITGVSPAFLIGSVGVSMLGSARLGARLALVQAAAQLALMLMFRICVADDPSPLPALPASEKTGAVRGAVEAILVVCGYMVVFAVASAALVGGTMLTAFADLPGGLAQLAEAELSLKPMLVGAAIGFTGVCICAQNVRALQGTGIGWRDVLLCRGMCACLCAIVARCVWIEADDAGFCPDAFAFSMLCALLCAVPALIYLTRTFILNKTKNASQ